MKKTTESKYLRRKRRITIVVPEKEINSWKKRFALYGSKTEFEDITRISRQTLNNILKNKSGDKSIIEGIRNYILVKSI